MSKPTPPSPLRQEDYLAIEAAVMETARGRWFLSEYARRNRNADTDTLLGAIDKLEKTLVKERAPGMAVERLKMDLADIASSIEKTKQEIAQIKHEDDVGTERFVRASSELDAIVTQTENATGEILNAAEKIQEHAWTLREQGADEDHCNVLDEQATNIYMACSFQDLTGQRIQKIVNAMRYVEKRINAMIDIWGVEEGEVNIDADELRKEDSRPDAHLLNGPALEGEGVNQSDVDNLFGSAEDTEEAGQDDVDALFGAANTIETEFSVSTSSSDSETLKAEDLDSIDFDAVDFDSVEFDAVETSVESPDLEVTSVQDDLAVESVEDAEPIVAVSEALGQSEDAQADVFAVSTVVPEIEATLVSNPREDMFETVAGGDVPEGGVSERSENGIEFVASPELGWAESVSLEDLEEADVFAATASDLKEEPVAGAADDLDLGGDIDVVAVSSESVDLVNEEVAQDLDLQEQGQELSVSEAVDAPSEMLDSDLDMIGIDDDRLMTEMHKVAAEMDRVASEMGLEGAGKSSASADQQQGNLEIEAVEPAPLQKRVTDFG